MEGFYILCRKELEAEEQLWKPHKNNRLLCSGKKKTITVIRKNMNNSKALD